MIRQGSLAPSKSCNREELHIRPVSFNLYILLLLHKVKNIAYSLKYKGQPILKALIFKDIALFQSYRDLKIAKQRIIFVLLEIHRNFVA